VSSRYVHEHWARLLPFLNQACGCAEKNGDRQGGTMPLANVSGAVQAFTIFTMLFCLGGVIVVSVITRRRQHEWEQMGRRPRRKRPE